MPCEGQVEGAAPGAFTPGPHQLALRVAVPLGPAPIVVEHGEAGTASRRARDDHMIRRRRIHPTRVVDLGESVVDFTRVAIASDDRVDRERHTSPGGAPDLGLEVDGPPERVSKSRQPRRARRDDTRHVERGEHRRRRELLSFVERYFVKREFWTAPAAHHERACCNDAKTRPDSSDHGPTPPEVYAAALRLDISGSFGRARDFFSASEQIPSDGGGRAEPRKGGWTPSAPCI